MQLAAKFFDLSPQGFQFRTQRIVQRGTRGAVAVFFKLRGQRLLFIVAHHDHLSFAPGLHLADLTLQRLSIADILVVKPFDDVAFLQPCLFRRAVFAHAHDPQPLFMGFDLHAQLHPLPHAMRRCETGLPRQPELAGLALRNRLPLEDRLILNERLAWQAGLTLLDHLPLLKRLTDLALDLSLAAQGEPFHRPRAGVFRSLSGGVECARALFGQQATLLSAGALAERQPAAQRQAENRAFHEP